MSVPSIGSSSDVQLVCYSYGAGGRFRSMAGTRRAGAYRLLIAICNSRQSAAAGGQRHAVTRGRGFSKRTYCARVCYFTIYRLMRALNVCHTQLFAMSAHSTPSKVLCICRASVRFYQHEPQQQNLLPWLGRQEISIDCCTMRRANAGSVTLSAYVVAEHTLLLNYITPYSCIKIL